MFSTRDSSTQIGEIQTGGVARMQANLCKYDPTAATIGKPPILGAGLLLVHL